MIKEIIDGKVIVKSKGKQTGTYLFSDFDDDELREERELLIEEIILESNMQGKNLYLHVHNVSYLHVLIFQIDEVLKKRTQERQITVPKIESNSISKT